MIVRDLKTGLSRRQLAVGAFGLSLGAVASSGLLSPASSRERVSDAPDAHRLGGGISYRQIGRWDVSRLNEILSVDMPAFSGTDATYTSASHPVVLYRVTYPSFSPERGNRPVVLTGLVAVPETQTARLPLVSYQHGTVYLKNEVPSDPEHSPETQLMIAQFAGQGYALIGADYVGMGESPEPQGYMVKGSHQQATADLLAAAHAVLADLGKESSDLFLAGWSQGGYVTMAMLERLERIGVSVRAAATASAPCDLWLALSAPLLFPRPNDAPWLTTIYSIIAFSYEIYYSVPGLARSMIKPDVYDVVSRAYNQEPFDPAQIPTDLKALINEPYFDPDFFAQSAFGRLAKENDAYRWAIRTPTRNYYGEADEAVRSQLARLPMDYNRALGGSSVEAVLTGNDTHRGTFARAVPLWKEWFDVLAR